MTIPPQQIALTLSQKVDLIKAADSGKSCQQLADQFQIGKTQASIMFNKKSDVLTEYEQNIDGDRKGKIVKTQNHDINCVCWKWFEKVSYQHIPVSGLTLQEKALKFSADLRNCDFKASNGWLKSFQKRHSIMFNVIFGESVGKPKETLDTWKEMLPTIIEGYNLDEIYDCDETGLFFCTLPEKSLTMEGEDYKGGKNLKTD